MATIVVIAAHNDDHALAMGGTIAKHYAEKDDVHTFIGSFGEMSHPHLKPEVIKKTRVQEAQRADKAYGGKGTVQFLGLRETKFYEDYERKHLEKSLGKKLRALKPSKIYLPATNDTHPDHIAISKLVQEIVKKRKLTCDIYGYYVYPNPRHLKKVKLIVDVSDTFKKKLQGLHAYKSQIHVFTHAFTNNLVYLYAIVWNWLTGFLHGKRFAETFYKLK